MANIVSEQLIKRFRDFASVMGVVETEAAIDEQRQTDGPSIIDRTTSRSR
jgi:hypothetical protein